MDINLDMEPCNQEEADLYIQHSLKQARALAIKLKVDALMEKILKSPHEVEKLLRATPLIEYWLARVVARSYRRKDAAWSKNERRLFDAMRNYVRLEAEERIADGRDN